jgi:hypothetical protein
VGSPPRAVRRRLLLPASIGLGGGRARALVARLSRLLARCARRAQRVVRGARSGQVLGRRCLLGGCGSEVVSFDLA